MSIGNERRAHYPTNASMFLFFCVGMNPQMMQMMGGKGMPMPMGKGMPPMQQLAPPGMDKSHKKKRDRARSASNTSNKNQNIMCCIMVSLFSP